MTTSTAVLPQAAPVARALPRAATILRLGAALCFIGHGAFGFITKAAWLPYFAVVGIPEPVAWRLMPLIGAIDVLAGMAVLFAPRRLPLVYMVLWAVWTALIRPLAGEPFFEAIERAGNYGVPLALLLLAGWQLPMSWRHLTERLDDVATDSLNIDRARTVLRWTVCLLLAGHGALGVITVKAGLTAHYAAIGLPSAATPVVGWFEIVLALAVAARPATGLLVFVAAWKLATESLFLVAGSPIWELVERSGSYAAPLALVALEYVRRQPVRATDLD